MRKNGQKKAKINQRYNKKNLNMSLHLSLEINPRMIWRATAITQIQAQSNARAMQSLWFDSVEL